VKEGSSASRRPLDRLRKAFGVMHRQTTRREVRADDRKFGILKARKCNSIRPEAYLQAMRKAQRHFSLVKVSL